MEGTPDRQTVRSWNHRVAADEGAQEGHAGLDGEIPEGTLVVIHSKWGKLIGTRIGGKEVVGRFDPHDSPKQGEVMELAVDMSRACLFDPASEKLI